MKSGLIVKEHSDGKVKSNRNVSKHESLMTKIGLANGAVFLIACTLILVIMLIGEFRIHISKDKQMMNVYISNTLNSVDNSLKDMGRVSLISFSDTETQYIIKNYSNESYKQKLENTEYLSGLFTSLVSIRDDVSGIYIMDEKSVIYSQDSLNPSHMRNVSETGFVQKIKQNEYLDGNISGCKLFFGQLPDYLHYQSLYANDPYKNNCIYLIRPVRSFSPQEEIGHIALITPVSTLRNIADQYLDSKMYYMMVSGEGEVICCQDGNLIGKSFSEVEPELHGRIEEISGSLSNAGGNEKGIIENFRGTRCIVSVQKSDYSDISLITAKPVMYVYDELKFDFISCIAVSVLSGLAAVIISCFITNRSLKRLMNFSEDMANFSIENRTKRYLVIKRDEVGVLKASFNQMMDYIDELLVKEYENKIRLQESEITEQNLSMLYLKNQIDPHFLYNTLDMIRIHAALNGDKETSEILMQLVTYYRLSTKVDSPLVTLSAEIDMLDAYMNLMKFRYMQLEYSRFVEGDIEGIRIPNFILQPLVENSLIHGLRNRNYRGHIILKAEKLIDDEGSVPENNTVRIIISDDGIGMDSKMLEELNAPMDNERCRISNKENGHIGVRNVQIRLSLYYGNNGSVKFSNNVDGGVTVTVLLKENIIHNEFIKQRDGADKEKTEL
ncbi:MAG: histidine kinase [Clostridiales bacterium]|nr:histidine kinase [Clostridiales bacterium]